MLDDSDKWGRLGPSKNSQILSLGKKPIVQKREMGKLGSRLGSLGANEYEAMILKDVEQMHGCGEALEGRLTRRGSEFKGGLCPDSVYDARGFWIEKFEGGVEFAFEDSGREEGEKSCETFDRPGPLFPAQRV